MESFENWMNFLVSRKANGLPLKEYSDLFAKLVWMTDDNGSSICKVIENWLLSEDLIRIEIALRFEEVFPFSSCEEMVSNLEHLKNKFPQFTVLCDEKIKKRPAQRDV